MKKIFAVALLSAAVATPAVAADQLYVGLDLGSSSVPGSSTNSFGGFVGYKLDKSATPFMGSGTLAIEGQYTSLGSYTFTTFTGFNPVTFAPMYGSETVSFSSMGVDAVALFPIPTVRNLSVFGKVGFNSVHVSCSFCGANSTTGVDLGFGAEYSLGNHMALRAGYQTFASSTDTLYIAGLYSF